jgi:periplasmic divalent cation tolerance protein
MEAWASIAGATGSHDEAAMIARTLVEERLAACVQLVPVRSAYRWDGAAQSDDESMLTIKTRADAAPAVGERIKVLRSYALPDVTVTPIIDGSPGYLEWVAASVAD